IHLWHEIGLPDGVINLVHGDGMLGKLLVEDSDIDAVFFTGSVSTGKRLMASLADSPQKLLALEMGGNNPLIIHECSDLKRAAENTILSAYISSGQRCTCARRLILVRGQESEKFMSLFEAMVKRIKYALPNDDEGAFIGTLISYEAAQHAMTVQADYVRNGGKIIIESTISETCPALVSPGLIDLTDAKDIPDLECFAPLLSVNYVDSFDAAIALANQTSYGLSAALFSDNETHWHEFYHRVRAGIINWNRQTTGASGALPFGGVGLSGNHRPSGAFAADFCSYPIASLSTDQLLDGVFPEGVSF
ncbi:MAG: aldehyde dehydrogenase family protein, partial [Lentisphaeria bacterium]|nr:aldehyde dehydrogenase family protein [Lentisphaeria bacterium]